MKHNTNEEKWIEEVLNSTQGMQKAQPRADLYEQILLGLNNKSSKSTAAPVMRYWAAAAILLVVINASSIAYYSRHKAPGAQLAATEKTDNPFGMEIQSQSTYNY